MVGRKPIQIDPKELQATIDTLEASNEFSSLAKLWEAVEQTEWAKTREPRPLTNQVAAILARKFALSIKTKAGKKGGIITVPHERKPRTKRILSDDIKANLKKQFPEHEKTVDRLASGSMKAAVKLKCLDCCCGSKKEIALCGTKDCPLWNFRPYKRDDSTKENPPEDNEN